MLADVVVDRVGAGVGGQKVGCVGAIEELGDPVVGVGIGVVDPVGEAVLPLGVEAEKAVGRLIGQRVATGDFQLVEAPPSAVLDAAEQHRTIDRCGPVGIGGRGPESQLHPVGQLGRRQRSFQSGECGQPPVRFGGGIGGRKVEGFKLHGTAGRGRAERSSLPLTMRCGSGRSCHTDLRNLTITPRHARTALVGIRGCVGVGALFAPSATGKLMGIDAEENPAAPYLARLFGVRELFMVAPFALGASDDVIDFTLRCGVAVDSVDALAAVAAGVTKSLPTQAAVMAGLVATAAAGLGAFACTEL